MAEFAAGNTCAQAVVADTDGFILEGISEVVFALGHGSNEDADTFVGGQSIDIVSNPDYVGVEAEGDFSAIWW
jgi:hypothetical protein